MRRLATGRRISGIGPRWSRLFRDLARGLAPVARVVETWLHRRRTRRHMTRLSDYLLKDIGITRADVDAEAHKPFWKE